MAVMRRTVGRSDCRTLILTASALLIAPHARSGIVWAAMPRHDKNALNGTVPGVLRAYRAYPDDGGKTLKELWNSDSGLHVAASDCKDPEPTGTNQLGDFAKFVPPTVAEGKVYMSTFSHRLVVYGLTEAPRETYDAELELKERPPSVEPGSRIKVEITATNKGSRAWRAARRATRSPSTRLTIRPWNSLPIPSSRHSRGRANSALTR